MKSRSLKALAQEMSIRLGYKVFRTTTQRANKVQFRYGSQVNKLDQYKWFKEKGLSSLVFTTNRAEAQAWVNQGITVFGRKTLNGSNGAGIEIYDATNPNVGQCLVYTQYKKKKREFRVHIFRNKVIAIVEKRKKGDHEGPSDPRVRNLANGYVFCQTVELTPALEARIKEVALKASMVCSKSDFRGVDLCYNEHANDVFIVEVNSAPGIEGTNVQTYCDAIQEVLH
jgi:glutathione synthase/RimK-type ligase-like ATP-grasp enzyme